MADAHPPERRDARRNRQLLLDAARDAFAGAGDEEVSLTAIARAAGLGIGTLYRHFPNREALVEAVYREEISRLRDGADRLLAVHPPAEALRRWVGEFGDYVATKRGMADTLRAVVASGVMTRTDVRALLSEAIARILEVGVAAGEVRNGVVAMDLLLGLVGAFAVCDGPQGREQAGRVCDLLLAAVLIEPGAEVN